MTERITPEQIARIRADYRAVVANTTNGGSAEDFATLAAWLPALLDEIERLEARNKAIIEGVQQGVDAISAAYDKEETRFYPHPTTFEEYEAVIALRERAAALAPLPAREEGATP